MPTNLPPECRAAEADFRAAQTQQEKIECLERSISLVPHHKGTDHLRADLTSRLAKLRDAAQHGKAGTRQESVFRIEREGSARAVVLGAPNVGKSALVAAMTKATPEVSAAPFSTWLPTPGMAKVDDIKIQLIDTPPLNRDHMEPDLFDLIRSADLLLLVVDLQANPEEQLADSIHILSDHRVPIRNLGRAEASPHGDYPTLVVVNKADAGLDEDMQILAELLDDQWPLVPAAAIGGRGLDVLGRAMVATLGLIRVYSKPPNKPVDRSNPFVLKAGDTVADFASQVHQDFLTRLKSARIWGSAVFDGQHVGRDHVLQDGDVVEMHM
jgi:uncharacterized protein